MIYKVKLIEALTDVETDISRDQIDWLCDNAEKFTGHFKKPYEISIDFGPIFVGIFSQMTYLSEKIQVLEAQLKPLLAPQTESDESIAQDECHIVCDSSESSEKLPLAEESTPE